VFQAEVVKKYQNIFYVQYFFIWKSCRL